jgi:hypothetical protein
MSPNIFLKVLKKLIETEPSSNLKISSQIISLFSPLTGKFLIIQVWCGPCGVIICIFTKRQNKPNKTKPIYQFISGYPKIIGIRR